MRVRGNSLSAVMLLGALSLCCAAIARAQAEVIRLDSRNVSIAFQVFNLGVWPVNGRFLSAAGAIDLDRAQPARSRLKVVAATASLHTEDGVGDDDLRSASLFDAAHYPQVVFESTGIALATPTSGTLNGNLAIRGVVRSVSLSFRFLPARGAALGNGPPPPIGRIEARGTVRRSLWGMTAYIPAISDEVSLDIQVELGK